MIRRIRCCRKLTEAEWQARVASMDARVGRTSGRHGLRIIDRAERTPEWTMAIDALIDHGSIDVRDRDEVITSMWVKNFICAACGSRSGFCRRDPGRFPGVRISCGHGCRTRDVKVALGLVTPPAWASEPEHVRQARRMQMERLMILEARSR